MLSGRFRSTERRKKSGNVEEDRRRQRASQALALDKAEREAARKAAELAEAQKKEASLLYLSEQETWADDMSLNAYAIAVYIASRRG